MWGIFIFYLCNMITGKKRETLTIEAVLKKLTPYDVFRWYMPTKDWKLNHVTLSPFRNERNPSFIIGNKHGTLSFVDFGDTSKRGDCFKFVQLLFNLRSIDDVLKMIDRDFGLGISSGKSTGEYKKITSEYKQPEADKRYSMIQVVTRKFTNEELAYWNAYHQDLQDLKDNNIYSIKKVYLNKQLFSINDNELRFGYFYDGHWKIYRPFADRKRKWLSNVPLTKSYGLKNLNNEHNSLICKSLKDYMVCKKIYPHVCHVQNESLASFSEETIDFINKNSKDVFYGGDSDKPGKDASFAITREFGFNHINPPDNLLPNIKDFADWGKEKGLEELKNHFIKKRLFGSFI